MTKRFFVLAAAALILAGAAQADEWAKKFDVAGAPALTFRAAEGHFRVETWDQKQISARVVTEGWRITDSSTALGSDEIRITASQSGDRVTIDLERARGGWHWDSGHRRIDIEIRLPRAADLTLRTSDGHVSITALSGNLDVQTSDGHITLADIRGKLRLRSSDGHIEGTGLDGMLDAETSDGRIRVRGRFDRLDLRTSDGSIEAEVLSGSRASTVWSLRSSDGNVVLRVPDGLAADLDARTQDGTITTDFPITVSGEVGRSHLQGKLNAGGSTIQLRTSDGNIRIGRL